jgi:cell cycle protein kinase DBF2
VHITDAIYSRRLIDVPDRRYSSLSQASAHPFFANLNFTNLRGVKPPFMPQLESDTDTGYFDDFENPEDMAKYKEVKDKQRNVEKVREKEEGPAARRKDRGVWMGFTFGKNVS